MNKKLTLLLDEAVIERAKRYAESNNQSLSEMVTRYFRYVTKLGGGKEWNRISRRGSLAELAGIIKIPKSLDVKANYRQHRAGKAMHG